MPRLFIPAIITIFATLLTGGATPGTSPTTHAFQIALQNGLNARFELSMDQDGGDFVVEEAEGALRFTNATHSVQILDNSANGVVEFRMENHFDMPFHVESLSMQTEIPIRDIEGIWAPSNLGTESVVAATAGQYFETIADANYGVPYIGAATADGRNLFSFGLLRQNLSAHIESGPTSEDQYGFRITETTPRSVTSLVEAFYVSLDPSLNWFQAAEKYSDWVDRERHYQPFPVGPEAFEPVYDTWYWSRDAVDDDLYARTSQIASEIGIGRFLVDSGWDAETGEYDKWLLGATGNYRPPLQKFPDIVQTFNFLRFGRQLGIHLWLQPFAVGRGSERYPLTADAHIATFPEPPENGWVGSVDWPVSLPHTDGLLENVNLCPRMIGTQEYLANLFDEMSFAYRPEGFWVDAIDFLPSACLAPHNHDYATFGEGLNAALEAIKSTVLKHNNNAVIQFRGPYANLNTKPYANVWQTPDSAGKPGQMQILAVKMRPFGKGTVFASDQLYWPNNLTEAETAKAAMTSTLVGVPAFGVDLLTAPPSTLHILETWLRFYRTYQPDLMRGKFGVFGSFRTPNHQIDSVERLFAFVRQVTAAPVDARNKSEIFLFNGTTSDSLKLFVQGDPRRSYTLTTFDRFMNPQTEDVVNGDEHGLILVDTPIDQGAMILLSSHRKTPTKPVTALN